MSYCKEFCIYKLNQVWTSIRCLYQLSFPDLSLAGAVVQGLFVERRGHALDRLPAHHRDTQERQPHTLISKGSLEKPFNPRVVCFASWRTQRQHANMQKDHRLGFKLKTFLLATMLPAVTQCSLKISDKPEEHLSNAFKEKGGEMQSDFGFIYHSIKSLQILAPFRS